MNDILDDLRDLHKQATTERSHYYVASCAMRAIVEIQHLRRDLARAVAQLGGNLKDSQMSRRATITQADRSS